MRIAKGLLAVCLALPLVVQLFEPALALSLFPPWQQQALLLWQ